MRVLLFVFILFPLLELALLIKVGSSIGVLTTLLLVIGSALVGGFLLRIAGPASSTHAGHSAGAAQPGQEAPKQSRPQIIEGEWERRDD
ncbi:phage T7 F exclusion suppressor FxsA [compost metagenome]